MPNSFPSVTPRPDDPVFALGEPTASEMMRMAGTSGRARDVLAQTRGVPAFSASGLMRDAILGRRGRRPRTSGNDVIRAMLLDREELTQAQRRMEQNYRTGLSTLEGARSTAVGNLRDLSRAAMVEGTDRIQGREQASLADVDRARQAYEALPGQEAAREQTGLQTAEGRRTRALNEIRDTTVQRIMSQRADIDRTYQQREESLLAARNRGELTEGGYRAELRRLQWDKQERLGRLTADLGTRHEELRANISLAYDQQTTQLQALYSQLGARAGTAAAAGSMQAAEIARSVRNQSEAWMQANLARGYQLAADAERLEYFAGKDVASMWANMPEYTAPFANIIAEAYQLQDSLAAGEGGFSFSVDQGAINPFIPAGRALSGGRQTTSRPGTPARRPRGLTTNPPPARTALEFSPGADSPWGAGAGGWVNPATGEVIHPAGAESVSAGTRRQFPMSLVDWRA